MNGRLEHEIKINNYINERLSDKPNYMREWQTNLAAAKKTPATRKEFLLRIIRFYAFVNDNNYSLESLSEKNIEKLLISSQTKTESDGTISYTSDSYQQNMWIALKNYCDFLFKHKYISENPMLNIDKPKNNDLERINANRVLLTKNDFKKIIRFVQPDTFGKKNDYLGEELAARDKAILALFMNTGMRETALTEINEDELKFNGVGYDLTITDKGNKKHTYVINEATSEYIDDWLLCKGHIPSNSDALFISEHGNRLVQDSVKNIVGKYTKLALGKKLSPHKLRAGFCSILYKETGDAEFVRRAVGHSSISTTQRYITTDNEEKKKASEIMNFI